MGGNTSTEQLLAAGLWALPGPGARSIAQIVAVYGGRLWSVLDLPFEEWLPELDLPYQAGDVLAAAREVGVRTAAQSAQRLFDRCRATRTLWAFEGDPAYPKRISEIRNPPAMLFYRGPGAGTRERKVVAMVGTRKTEQRVLAIARQYAATIARSDIVVVSGAARGIDTWCHLGALDVAGETWAFLGASIDQADSHQREIGAQILGGGGTVFSELPPGVRADRQTFPRRNRLIAGASDVTIVARAPFGSGALLTADDALAQHRPVLAIPGDVDSKTAEGCNYLLRTGKAQPCVGAMDIARALQIPESAMVPAPPRPLATLPQGMSLEARAVFEALKGRPMDYDTLMEASGLPSGKLSAALTALELEGAVYERPGRIYCRAQ